MGQGDRGRGYLHSMGIFMSFVISLGVGFAVGLLYWSLKVQSPAPPLIALAGLLGMVLGEHAVPVVKAQFATSVSASKPASVSATQTPAPFRRAADDADSTRNKSS